MAKKGKIFWLNFFTALLIFTGACFVLYLSSQEYAQEYGSRWDFQSIYNIISFFAVIYLCVRIGMDFARYEEIEEFIKEKGLTRQEFFERYGDLVEKIIK